MEPWWHAYRTMTGLIEASATDSRSACVTPVRRVPGALAARPVILVLRGEGAAEGAEARAMVAVLGAPGHQR
jgi:hypothetical protein